MCYKIFIIKNNLYPHPLSLPDSLKATSQAKIEGESKSRSFNNVLYFRNHLSM